MSEQDAKRNQNGMKNLRRNMLVSASAGCLTLVVAGAALVAGLLIDARLGTAPRWTLILLLGSAPFSFGGVYLIVRRALKRNREEGQRVDEGNLKED